MGNQVEKDATMLMEGMAREAQMQKEVNEMKKKLEASESMVAALSQQLADLNLSGVQKKGK